MNIKVMPGALSGHVQAVASKSHAHRLLIAAALCEDVPEVSISTTSADIEATKACLAQLDKSEPILNCGESGSTLRFMIPVAMSLKDKATFTGKGRLPHRPLSPLNSELEKHGCTFEMAQPEGEDMQKICKISGRLQPGNFTLPGNISSQYITGLLFALPLLDGDSRIEITTPLESSKYIDMTLAVLEQFNIKITTTFDNNCPTYIVQGNQKYIPSGTIAAEGDWSNGAFWIIAGILGAEQALICENLSKFSLQGDKAILELAIQMGGGSLTFPNRFGTYRAQLNAIDIDASEIPDLVPILAVAAATAKGTTRIYNAGRLRIKESDRLAAMCDCLTRVGADITETADGLIIHGVSALNGGTVSGYNDHRIVMAMAIASIVSENPIIIEGAEAVNKSYPAFFEDFKSLGGEFRVI